MGQARTAHLELPARLDPANCALDFYFFLVSAPALRSLLVDFDRIANLFLSDKIFIPARPNRYQQWPATQLKHCARRSNASEPTATRMLVICSARHA